MKRDIWIGTVITIVLILGLEFGLRYYEYRNVPPQLFWELDDWEVEDAETDWIPRPGFVYGEARINTLSFPGPETTIEKPTGITRIVSLGESTTIGVYWHPSYPELLQQAVGDCPVEFINAGVEGYD